MKNIPAIILAGGLGTRLRSVVNDLPKPMAPINGKPFLHYIFVYLERQGIKEVILSVGYKHETIREYFGDEYLGIAIQYSIEHEPLGTGGALKKACALCEELAYVLNGDTFFDINLKKLLDHFYNNVSEITIALKPMKNFDRYGSVEIDEETTRIKSFNEKKFLHEGLINAGVYVINSRSLIREVKQDSFSFEKEILEKQVSKYWFTGMVSDNYFIDIGVPDDYAKAQEDFKEIFR